MALAIRLPRLQVASALVVPLVAVLEVCCSVRGLAGHALAPTTHDLAGGVGFVATLGLRSSRRLLLLPWLLLLLRATLLCRLREGRSYGVASSGYTCTRVGLLNHLIERGEQLVQPSCVERGRRRRKRIGQQGLCLHNSIVRPACLEMTADFAKREDSHHVLQRHRRLTDAGEHRGHTSESGACTVCWIGELSHRRDNAELGCNDVGRDEMLPQMRDKHGRAADHDGVVVVEGEAAAGEVHGQNVRE